MCTSATGSRACNVETLATVRRAFVVRHSAIVLSELRRGARTRQAQKFVDTLHRLARPCWEPAAIDWWEAGRLIRRIGDAEGWETGKRREFQNDALIALTARRYGAAILTTNHADFTLLAQELRIHVMSV